MEALWLFVLIVMRFNTALSEFCVQGEDEGCAFECHCAKDDECRQGCPSGCDKGRLGHDWGGPACQIGNVGLNKMANMTSLVGQNRMNYPPNAALDDVVPDGHIKTYCARCSNNETLPAEWWADLGDIYEIYNITVYNRRDVNFNRLQNFDITIYNTSDNEVLCAHQGNMIQSSKTIPCITSVIGRYVHFRKKGDPYINVLVLCEVIITGHKVYDCSTCPTGVTCDDVTGCEACSGSYQPECRPGCNMGSYGTNCDDKCGHCKTGNKCETITGQCYDGCELWWNGDTCKLFIDKPVLTNETLKIQRKTSDSVTVQWEKLKSIPSNLETFYGYDVVYKENSSSVFMTATSIGHHSESDVLNAAVINLNFNTNYDIEVRPYRVMMDTKDLGESYETLHVKTPCTVPEDPFIEKLTTSSREGDELPNITVYYQKPSDVNPNCETIKNSSLNYKTREDVVHEQIPVPLNGQIYIIVPDTVGRYQIWLTVTNNEGYSSDSKIHGINIKFDDSTEQNTIIISVVVSVVIILVIIGVVIVVVLRKKSRQNEMAHHQYINSSFMRDQREDEDKVDCFKPALNDTSSAGEPEEGIDKSSKDNIYNAAMSDPGTNCSLEEVSEEGQSLYDNIAINVVNFEGYVARRKHQLKELYKEFDSLPKEDMDRCHIALSAENKPKNRFRGVYPYDETRVVLEKDDGDDYINATYITGFNKQKEYIATQGTRSNTLADFWRMIWQEKSNRIVMLANVTEMGKQKVEQYWPEQTGESRVFGRFTITMEGAQTCSDYTTRIMTVKKGSECRTIYHLHFTTWEDNNLPRYGTHTLLAFINRVHSFDKFSQGPLVVHCSAGVGRTGTFIAFDILREMAIKEKSIDVYNCVKKLRQERMNMVQTKVQYIFLHDVLVEFIKFENTSFDCDVFRQKFTSLSEGQQDPEVISQLEKELKLLHDTKQANKNLNKSGIDNENMKKNRNPQIIPDDSKRLYISSKNENYINAVPVDSFAAHDAITVTQMPLPNTVSDFWKLVIEQNCEAIFMLNGVDCKDQECLPYWPKEVNSKKTYGQVEVEVLSVDVDEALDFIVMRNFRVKEIKESKLSPPVVLTVKHFQLTSWPNDQFLPPQRSHVLEFIEQLQAWNQRSGHSSHQTTTLVHCLDGGSRSGMFCGASFVLDRMKAEQEVNVYLAAKYVSRTRPQFFITLNEYRFLYQMPADYLIKYNDYANFL